ncbi:SRPBCC family protein [Actinomycetes bacterium M1A6_2h]
MPPEAATPLASGSVTVEASPDAVYAALTDLARFSELADETHSMQWTSGESARPGAKFKGRNRNGLHRWSTTCTVTDAFPNKVFAFDVHYGPTSIPIAHWRYDIETIDSKTMVTERMWDRRPGWFVGIGGLATGVRDRGTVNAQHIEATLQRLRRMVDVSAG